MNQKEYRRFLDMDSSNDMKSSLSGGSFYSKGNSTGRDHNDK